MLTQIFSLCFCARVCPERLRYGGAAEVTPAEPGPVGAVLPLQSPAPPSSSPPPPPPSSSPPGGPRPAFHPVAGPPQQDRQLHHPAPLGGFNFLHRHHHHQPPQGRPPHQTSSSGPGSALPAGAPLPVLLQPRPGPLSVRDHTRRGPASGHRAFRLPAGLLHGGRGLASRLAQLLQLSGAGRGERRRWGWGGKEGGVARGVGASL